MLILFGGVEVMGLRVRKSVKIAPNTRLNISKNGVSTTTHLAKGVSYRTQIAGGRKRKSKTTKTATGPIIFRWWWFVLALVLIMSAGATHEDPQVANSAAILSIIGMVMILISIVAVVLRLVAKIRKPKKPEEAEETEV